jgi:putative phosphoesterase
MYGADTRMKIGIISDTHNNSEYTSKAVKYLKHEEKVKKIYHLGDEWEDIPVAAKEGVPIITVPGIYAEQYKDPSIPNKIVEEINGFNIILTHDLNDLTREDIEGNDIILSGHTHSYELKCSLGKLYLNPGHLKEEYHKGRIATFASIKIGESGVKAKIFDINFNLTAKINMPGAA